jgi:hypothetical protein
MFITLHEEVVTFVNPGPSVKPCHVLRVLRKKYPIRGARDIG